MSSKILPPYVAHREPITVASILSGTTDAGRSRLLYRTAELVAARWYAAGYTTFALNVAGLPQPAKGHAAAWDDRDCCVTCGRPAPWGDASANFCKGRFPFDAIREALDRGVPFGIEPLDVEQLPRAGVALDHAGTIQRLSRATCEPLRRRAA